MRVTKQVYRPTYNKKVHISGWTDVYEAFPLDNEFPVKSQSHYRSLGPTPEVFVPKTTAREAMESGTQKKSSSRAIQRSTVNFTSFPLIDQIVEQEDKGKEDRTFLFQSAPISTYKRDYVYDYIPKKGPCDDMEAPHILFNRIPKNDFTMASPSAPHKFMDNHLFENREKGRLCIEHMRQMRNSSTVFPNYK